VLVRLCCRDRPSCSSSSSRRRRRRSNVSTADVDTPISQPDPISDAWQCADVTTGTAAASCPV
jgi:hypothetical protein